MPARIKIILGFLIALVVAGPVDAYEAPANTAPRPFNYATDTFSFANETVWNYVGGAVKTESATAEKREYTRHCFVLTRAAVQFWKFARFDAAAKPLPADQFATRIRDITERSVWLPALSIADRVVIPGYANLRQASTDQPAIFQANIGLGWPVYVRPGNAPIAVPASRSTESRLNDEIYADLQKNNPSIVWLYLFPSLKINHVVVVFAGYRAGDLYRYQVYDPNYSDASKQLEFNATTNTFSYQPTFYFKGGPVTARAIFRGLFQ